jgi:glutamate formiminotransferase/formiminotetrahydrofolate cyclodeaminase
MPTETYDASSTVRDFLDATAAKQPAPGGGSAAALAGALSAAVGEMVLNYSVGKKDLAAHEPELREVLNELARARRVMLELMAEDQSAFAALSAARKACGDKGDRDPAFAAALLACIRIPQSVAAAAAAVLDLCGRVAPLANKFLLSDLAVCAELAMATVRCAAYNVHVNLADVSDAAERKRFEDSTSALVGGATARVRQTIPAIWNRIGRTGA